MRSLAILVSIFLTQSLFSQVNFDDYFIPKTMRVDYMLCGNHNEEHVYFEQIRQEPFWGGSKKNLVDTFNYGAYKVSVADSASGKLIYSRGYGSLFQEWQSTDEAKSLKRSFYETVVFPYPKKAVKIIIEKRSKLNTLSKIFEMYINPGNYFIRKEMPMRLSANKLFDSGDPSVKLDIVLIPEGYTKEEIKKLKDDAGKLVDLMTKQEPFAIYKEKINIWLVEAFSAETGTDVPGENIWKNTVVNSSFYTFNSDRYLMTSDIKSVRDIASNAPYDQIMIMVNSKTYGGGGIFNYYSISSIDNIYSGSVFLHEFGHAFAGLGDEYYTSEVAVENFYSFEVEPWEPNLTVNKNFEKKWKSMIDKDTPIPTPVSIMYSSKVGLYEGAGYSAKGIYRAFQRCEMKELQAGFCPVCKKAIKEMLDFYTK